MLPLPPIASTMASASCAPLWYSLASTSFATPSTPPPDDTENHGMSASLAALMPSVMRSFGTVSLTITSTPSSTHCFVWLTAATTSPPVSTLFTVHPRASASSVNTSR